MAELWVGSCFSSQTARGFPMGATQPMSKVYANKMLKAVGAQNLRNFLTNFNTNYSPCKAETAVFSLIQF